MTMTTLEPSALTTATGSMPATAPAIPETRRRLAMQWSMVNGGLAARWGHRPTELDVSVAILACATPEPRS